MGQGIIYVFTNKAMPGICKIGKTKDLDRRLSDLYNTSVPYKFICEFAVEVKDMDKAETILHDMCDEYRLNPNREFFDEAAKNKVVNAFRLAEATSTDFKIKNLAQKEEETLDDILSKEDNDSNIFYLKGQNYYAVAEEIKGKIRVKAGSYIVQKENKSLSESGRKLREELFKNQIEIKDGKAVFKKDYDFPSWNAAATVIAGGMINARLTWKTEDGRTLSNFIEKDGLRI